MLNHFLTAVQDKMASGGEAHHTNLGRVNGIFRSLAPHFHHGFPEIIQRVWVVILRNCHITEKEISCAGVTVVEDERREAGLGKSPGDFRAFDLSGKPVVASSWADDYSCAIRVVWFGKKYRQFAGVRRKAEHQHCQQYKGDSSHDSKWK